jgi:hypothetical protein
MIPRRQISPKTKPTAVFCQEKFALNVGMLNVNAARRNSPVSETLVKYRERMLECVFGNLLKIDPLKL